MRLEWDPRKNETNLQKHGIDFADACEIFDSPMLTWLDDRRDYGEDRWCGIGLTNGRIVKIVFTERDDGETIRIISVRKANRREQERYREVLPH